MKGRPLLFLLGAYFLISTVVGIYATAVSPVDEVSPLGAFLVPSVAFTVPFELLSPHAYYFDSLVGSIIAGLIGLVFMTKSLWTPPKRAEVQVSKVK
jgi:hypothetical protein